MTTDNNRGLVDVAPIVPLGIIPDSETAKPVSVHRLELRVCGSLLLVLLIALLATFVTLEVSASKASPNWTALALVWPLVLPLVGVLAALAKRTYLRYVHVRQV